MEKSPMWSSGRFMGMDPFWHGVLSNPHWLSSSSSWSDENHSLQLRNWLQFFPVQLSKAWYEMFHGLWTVPGNCLQKCWNNDWRCGWWTRPGIRIQSWSMCTQVTDSFIDCLSLSVYPNVRGASCASPPRGEPWNGKRMVSIMLKRSIYHILCLMHPL